jgi:IS30 family transposase
VANHLSVTKSNAIKKLHQQGQSQREIAEALSVDRKTVRRHLAVDPTVEDTAEDSKGTSAPTGIWLIGNC